VTLLFTCTDIAPFCAS